jgi:ankyrin repeat protein
VNVRDVDRCSPIHYAAKNDDSNLIEKLLEAGARPDAIDFMQQTPLMIAASIGAMHAASTLVKHGANLAAGNFVGGTALHYCAQKDSVEMFVLLLDSGCDPYQLDDKEYSPLYYALSSSQLATYIYARCLDLSHILCADRFPDVVSGTHAMHSLLRYFSEADRHKLMTMRMKNGDTVLADCALYDDPDDIRAYIKAGAHLEATCKNGDTALLAACRVGHLPPVACLVRQGAKLEYEHHGRMLNVYKAACGHPEIIKWLLVNRWTEQGKLGSEPTNSEEHIQCEPWTGVRTVNIPLRGDYERPEGSSLFDHAKYLHGVVKGGWRILVPLSWDTVENLVPLPGET